MSPIHFLGWLTSEQWAAVEALSTAITALVAVAAAIFAFVQVRQARLLRVEQSRPFVVANFEPSPVSSKYTELVIENIGTTIATNVTIKFDRPLESADNVEGFELSKSPLLTQGIPMMPPGMRVTGLFDSFPARRDSDLPMSYSATVKFSDFRGKPQEPLTYLLDLNFRNSLVHITEYGVHDAAKALREMEKSMKKWTDHFNGIRVYVKDEDAQSFADNWQRRKGGEAASLGRPMPAGRPAPSRFGSYAEPIWKRLYWALRILITSGKRRRELRAQIQQRPDLAPFLTKELETFTGSNLLRLVGQQLVR
jgi:hypothetical protein